MNLSIRRMIFTKSFGLALLILSGFFGYSLFLQYDQGIILPIVILSDVMSPYNEYARHSNYDASNVLDWNDAENPHSEYEYFRNAFFDCYAATVNPEIYTIEGDPI